MTHGQLFGGIAGFGLAAQWAGITNTWYNEIDPYCCEVVRARIEDGSFKDKFEVIEGDIRNIGKHNLQPVDIISGGFPCQPFSVAGKRKGKADDRYLWPEMLRVIRELKPAFVVGENVAGLQSMENGRTLEGILIDLENIGYQVEAFLIPASAVGAWHRRNRVWIVAQHTDTIGAGSHRKEMHINGSPEFRNQQECDAEQVCEYVSDARLNNHGLRNDENEVLFRNFQETGQKGGSILWSEQWQVEPNVGRVANGIPRRVDRLKALGNAIVPQVAYEIFKAIQEANEQIQSN